MTSNNDNKSQHLPSSNLKRKRITSASLSSSPSTTINSSISNQLKHPDTHLETLHCLFLSFRSQEFRGPSLTYKRNNHNQMSSLSREKHCFICLKSSTKHGPSIHCDYCPLIYHLDCLTPPMTSLPLPHQKWMCPNHMEPILDRHLSNKDEFSTNERVKIYHQCSQVQDHTILQEFTYITPAKNSLILNKINNYQLECMDISQIPKSIEDSYLKANTRQKQISDIESDNSKGKSEDECVQVTWRFFVFS